MSAEVVDDRRAPAGCVEARLGRAPQDMLEAAVVLEAWAGVPAQRALETARGLMPRDAGRAARERVQAPGRARRAPGCCSEGAAFVADRARDRAVGRAAGGGARRGRSSSARCKVALPLTLALQWGLRSRYLGRPKGLLGFARHRCALAVGAVAVIVLAPRSCSARAARSPGC